MKEEVLAMKKKRPQRAAFHLPTRQSARNQRHSEGRYLGLMAEDAHFHFNWPEPTSVGVSVRSPVALGTVDVTVTTPVVSVMATALTYLVAPGKLYPVLVAVTEVKLPNEDVVSATASFAGAAITSTSVTFDRVA